MKYNFVSASVIWLIIFSPASMQSQLKYIGENIGATAVTGEYTSVDGAMSYSVGVDYSRDGKFGIGASFLAVNPGNGKGIGVQGEFAILRPITETTIGINVFGSASLMKFSVERTVNSTSTTSAQSASFGAEFYLHTVTEEKFRVEPFVQVAHSFSEYSESEQSKKLSLNFIGIGIDFVIGDKTSNAFIITPGVIFQEKTDAAFALNIAYVFVKNKKGN